MAAIDKVIFASVCARNADFCGVNTHYLAAVAELRSGTSDGSVEGGIGPFRFTQAEWDRHRIDPEFQPDFISSDIVNWRMQCSVFARMTHKALSKLIADGSRQTPSALGLYAAQLAAAGQTVAPADLPKLEQELTTALEATADAIRRAEAELLDGVDAPAEPGPTEQVVLFRRAPGHAPVKGHLVTLMQEALIRRGHMPRVHAEGETNADGMFGPITEAAVEAWQTASGNASTGAITVGEWRDLTDTPPPGLFDLCAQVTAAFEGTGFSGTNETDFDHAVLTLGYHGFTLSGGSLIAFLKALDSASPHLIDQAFGAPLRKSLRALMAEDQSQVVARARELFLAGSDVRPEWRAGFARLGEFPNAARANSRSAARSIGPMRVKCGPS